MSEISVIMPVYNTDEKYLREAIESILKQTFTNFEFLILNDGSTNNVQEVLESYDDKRIKIIQGEHKGIGYALNTLVKSAQSKYIARMDSDDISLPNRFEEQYNYLETHPEISILGTLIQYFPKRKDIKYKQNPHFLDFFRKCSIAHPTVMMRKCDLEKYNLNYDKELKVSEDYDLWCRAVIHLKFHILQKTLLYYRVNNESNSRKNRIPTMQQDYKIRKTMLNFLTDNEKLQNKITKMVIKPKFSKRIFSLSNKLYNNICYKTLTLFGINFRLYKKENKVMNEN